VVGVAGGKRVIVAQVVADYGGRIQTSYRIGPEAATVDVKSPFGAFQLAGKVTAGKLVVTGSDATGKPVSLTAPLPAGAFLSDPGIGGSIMLAEKLAGMKVGDKRALASLEIGTFPATAIVATTYDVERQPDANGHRVFAVTTKVDKNVATGALELDGDGFVVSRKVGGPFEVVITRRAP